MVVLANSRATASRLSTGGKVLVRLGKGTLGQGRRNVCVEKNRIPMRATRTLLAER